MKKISVFLLPISVVVAIIIYAEAQTKLVSNLVASDRRVMRPSGITIQYSANSKPVFAKGKNGFLCATKDGATYYNYKGNAVWSQTYTMSEQYIISDDNKYAILEPMGAKAIICDETGVLYTAQSNHPIISGGISGLANVMLIQKAESLYLIPLYDQTGNSPLTHKSELENVFPVSVDVSDDGYMFAISWIDTASTTLLSRVLYSYTDAGAKRFSQSAQTPFKAIERPDSIISNIRFFNDGNLLLAGDTEFTITTNSGDTVAAIVPENRIVLTSFSDTMFGFVNGEALPNSENPKPHYLAEWYSSAATKLGEFSAGNFESMEIFGELILLKDEMFYYCLDKSGKVAWKISGGQDIISVIPIDKKRAVVARGENAEIYELKRPD